MRLIGIAATLLLVTLVAAGCKHRREEPVPGPHAGSWATPAARPGHLSGGTSAPGANPPAAPRHHGASGISWFQGGFEEAFSCPKCTVMLWGER